MSIPGEKKYGTKISAGVDDVVLNVEKVCCDERESKFQQKGVVLWLTGFSGAGKTTLANRLERYLFDQNKLVYVLDRTGMVNGQGIASLGSSKATPLAFSGA